MTNLSLDNLRNAQELFDRYKPNERFHYIMPRWMYDRLSPEDQRIADNSKTIHVSDHLPADFGAYRIDTEFEPLP